MSHLAAPGVWNVDIAPDATITIEGCNFKGKSCELPTGILGALGKTTSSKKKAEFFQGQGVAAQQTAGRGSA